MSEVYSLKHELKEMAKMLQDIKKGAKNLLDEPDLEEAETKRTSTRILSGEQRRLASSSSWARSTTKKEYPLIKRKVDEPQSTIDVLRSERYVKTRTPEYTFGIRPDTEKKGPTDDYFTGDYDIKVETLSTKKRPRVSTISKTARLDPYGYERPKIETVAQSTANNATGSDLPQDIDQGAAMDIVGEAGSDDQQSADQTMKVERVATAPKTYSFGKDKRFPEEPPRPPVKSTTDQTKETEAVVDIPDVEKAFKAVIAHGSSAVMGPAPSKSSHARLDAPMEPPTEPAVNDIHLEALAYRPRTPNVTMRPEHKFDKYKVTNSVELGTPGPGYYNVPDSAVRKPQKSHSKPVGTIYHTTTRPKKEAALNAKQLVEYESAVSVGPGTYAVDKSYSYVKQKAPALAIMRNADSKHTPQMERKLYFEQKAKDMREVHDNMRETNINLVTARVPTVSLAPPKWSKDDPKRRQILQDHRLENMRCRSVSRSDAASRIANILGRSLDDQDMARRSSELFRSPDRRYTAVEKRVPTGAFMGAEVSARRSTSARIQSRPGIANKIADEKFGIPAEQRFYGPQIPVPWAEDHLPRSKTPGGMARGDGGSDDEGYESPLDDVNRMLAERSGRVSSLGDEMNDTEYTQAYLKSRYSGSLQPKRPAVVMTEPKPGESRNAVHNKMTVEEAGFEYIGPQLQPDWLANSERRDVKHKNQALRMDLVPGREIKKLHQKGVAEVIDFTDRITAVDPMGPGYYDVGSNLEMAKAADKALGVPFSKAIARKDQVGAFGERPEAALEPIPGEDGDVGGLYFDDQLDIDFGAAKDRATEYKRNKSFQLYQKDRHKEPKPNLDDHLGGSWFEGMAEEALHKPNAALDFSKMTGRPAAAEQELENELFEEVAGPVDGEVDLQVQDWHPNKPKSAPGYVMQNPAKHPRFPKEKPRIEKPFDPDAPLSPLPNYDYLKSKEPVLVNMDKMRGRIDQDSDYEEAVLREVEGEQIDMEGANEALAERDEGITRGRAARSGQKRTPQAVDMSKQIGRSDHEHGGANTTEGAQALLDHLDGQHEARLYDNPELTAPILRNPKDINRGDGGGARDWSKVPGRELVSEVAAAEALGEEFGVKEELDLAPVHDATSKHKRMQSGPEWEKSDAVPRFAAGQGKRVNADGDFVHEERLLDLADVDPGKFKKGMSGFGAPGAAAGPNMSNQVGRSAPLKEQEVLATAGLQPEELILEPGENPMTKKQPSAQFGSKGNTAGVEGTLAGAKALQELRVAESELMLEPNDDFKRMNVPGGTAMRNKAAQSTRHGDAVEAEIRNGLEELQLDPTSADRAVRKNPVSATAMSNKQGGRETRHEAQLEAEARQAATVLKLEPTDAAIQPRVTGGTTMGNKSTRVASGAETKAIAAYNRASTEELKIEPKIAATRVSIPNASAMASKETRIRSSQEDLVDRDARSSAEVLDLEPDLQGSSSRRRLKSANTMSNTAIRFPTQKEATIEEEVQQEVEPELLIIDPSDATVRKKGTTAKFGSERTGRETVTKKPDATTTATETTKRGSAASLGGTSKTAVSATKTTAPAGSSSSSKKLAAGTGSAKKASAPLASSATKTASKQASEGPASLDDPGTPRVAVPPLTVKAPAPRPKKADAVYDNMSPNAMINMIDMQTKKEPTK